MAAIIETTLYESHGGAVIPGSTVTGASRDDLRRPYEVSCHSVDAATTYAWSLTFTPTSPGTVGGATPHEGTPSSAALTAAATRDTTFEVDFAGSYLLKLTVDLGLPTESTQYVRLRRLTAFGDMKLVASGERRDGTGIIPVDVAADGWMLDQNQNIQRLMLMVRRAMTSGRVLYVDANRGRDNVNPQNDPSILVYLPGTDSAANEESGTKLTAEGFADFYSITDAITYAAATGARGEGAPSISNPYFVIIQPGLYVEDLTLYPHVHLIGNGAVPDLYYDPAASNYKLLAPVRVQSRGVASHTFTTLNDYNDVVLMQNIAFTNSVNRTQALWDITGGKTFFKDCVLYDTGVGANQGEVVRAVSATKPTWMTFSGCKLRKEGAGETVIRANTLSCKLEILDRTIITQNSLNDGIWFNETLYADTWLSIHDSEIYGNLLGVGFCGDTLDCQRSVISGSAGSVSIAALVTAGPKSGRLLVELRDLTLTGNVLFDNTVCDATTFFYRNLVSTTSAPVEFSLVGGGSMPATFEVFGRFPKGYKSVNNGMSPYQAMNSDEVIGVTTAGGAVTVNLPQTYELGKILTIKDEGGVAAGTPITVASSFGATIDGAASLSVDINYAAASLYHNGVNWFVV